MIITYAQSAVKVTIATTCPSAMKARAAMLTLEMPPAEESVELVEPNQLNG